MKQKNQEGLTLKPLQQQQQQLIKLKPSSITECIKSPTGNLAVMEQKGFDVLAFVSLHISNVNLAFNFDNLMTIPQIQNCAKTLIDKYWTYTPEDFAMVCQKMKELKLIKNFYNSIDETKFYQAFEIYDTDREKEIEKILESERIQKENEFSNVFTNALAAAPDGILKVLKEINEKLMKPKVNAPVVERIKTPVEQLFQDIIKEFDKLSAGQWSGKIKPAIAWIDYKNEKMDLEKFCNTRFIELDQSKINELMPLITYDSIFFANGKRYKCDSAYAWNGNDICINYHEVNVYGHDIGPHKTRSHIQIKKDIRNGTITFKN